MAVVKKFFRGERIDLPKDFKGRAVDIYLLDDDIYFVYRDENEMKIEDEFEKVWKDAYSFLN